MLSAFMVEIRLLPWTFTDARDMDAELNSVFIFVKSTFSCDRKFKIKSHCEI